MVKKKNNNRRQPKTADAQGTTFEDYLSTKAKEKLLGLGDTNIKNMIAAARKDPKVLEAEAKFAGKKK